MRGAGLRRLTPQTKRSSDTEVLTPRRGQDGTSTSYSDRLQHFETWSSTPSVPTPSRPSTPEPMSRELYPLWGVGPGGGREPPFLEVLKRPRVRTSLRTSPLSGFTQPAGAAATLPGLPRPAGRSKALKRLIECALNGRRTTRRRGVPLTPLNGIVMHRYHNNIRIMFTFSLACARSCRQT